MTVATRNQARRRKGATRQVKSAGWTDERRYWADEERAEGEAWLLRGSVEIRDYWQPHGGTYVYFIQAEGLPEVKIGYAANPITRLGELQCGNARDLTVSALILGSKITERELHRFWREAHVLGEWFGNGYEQAIIGLAYAIGEQQIKDHKAGCDLPYLRDTLPVQVLNARSEAEAYAEALARYEAEEAQAA